ncbi:phosphoribosyltransferase [Sphingomonas sp. 36D10-4-7]|uniref:Phosphoribosyltransferase n=2 Tax=Sphingomonas corticis TaxID=2722791 RepID=A0ABX1CRZ5_9SPHN|nr:phosphoribosyltransferase [Sphingomonas corticis]
MVHCRRKALFDDWRYEQAKRHADARRAVELCEDLCSEKVIGELYDLGCDTDPPAIVVAPAMPVGETRNALGRGFAAWLARETSLGVETRIVQTNAVKRDLITNPYQRLAHSPTFEGPVQQGGSYILADDVFTMGGTLAALRGFIESRGGNVVAITTIAEKEGLHVPISLDPETKTALYAVHGGVLASLVPQRIGFGLDCLTQPEGRFLLREPSADAIRAGLDRARDC